MIDKPPFRNFPKLYCAFYYIKLPQKVDVDLYYEISKKTGRAYYNRAYPY